MTARSHEKCVYLYLGLVDYSEAWKLQHRLLQSLQRGAVPHVLLLLQHPHTITLGKSGRKQHLLADPEQMAKEQVTFVVTDRGGDVTYHGPGQLIGYPLLDLSRLKEDIGWYLRRLEEVLIRTLADFGISAERKRGYTGVWVGEEKVAAMGIKIQRWTTMHGFALNISTDLRYFRWIVPCGIHDKGVCSIETLLRRKVSVEEVLPHVVEHFGGVFSLKMLPYNHFSWPELTEALQPVLGSLPETSPRGRAAASTPL